MGADSTSRIAFFSAALVAMTSAGALAETVDCRMIRRVPETITAPGIYCLAGDLTFAAATGTAVTIASDDVVLDLNSLTLDGTAGPGTQAVGVGTTSHSNVVVKNGTVRGFATGIQMSLATGAVVEGIRAVSNTAAGIAAGGVGVQVRGNLVLATGGSTIPGSRAHGIAVRGPGGLVADNHVVDTEAVAGSFAYGIHATASDGMVIEGNRVTNSAPPTGVLFGIIVPFSQHVVVSDNRVTNATHAVVYSSGGSGSFRDNLTSGVSDPYPVFDGAGFAAGNNQ